jgi:ubiquinone/menaquinone biosynthesis C-methylase UbiE
VSGGSDRESQLLAGQVDYYRVRAPEYDRWFLRQGRYDRGEAATAAWFAELGEVRAALARLPIEGDEVLELAAGTGIWTELLIGRARHVTAVDASPEMLALNRRRLGGGARSVSYVVADLFQWRPERLFDAAVLCFWISHVPGARLDDFLRGLAAMVRPGGAVFFLDTLAEPTATSSDHQLPAEDEEVMLRRLDDGREFRIVKNFWSAGELVTRFRAAGLDVAVHQTRRYFQFGAGTRLQTDAD